MSKARKSRGADAPLLCWQGTKPRGGRKRRVAEKGIACAICSAPLDEFFARYPGAVCDDCDARAVNERGEPARHVSQYPESIEYAKANPGVLVDFGDDGDNPVFIDGHRCRRLYKFGGWVTMKEPS